MGRRPDAKGWQLYRHSRRKRHRVYKKQRQHQYEISRKFREQSRVKFCWGCGRRLTFYNSRHHAYCNDCYVVMEQTADPRRR